MRHTLFVATILIAMGCNGAHSTRRAGATGTLASGGTLTGTASYYAHKYHGGKTASGERFNMHALTAAHRTLPFGTQVKVTNLANGRSATVRINDRGPSKRERIIDVSYATAQKLGFIRQGLTRVRLTILR